MSNSKAFEKKRKERIAAFLCVHEATFIYDFPLLTDKQMQKKYNLGESFYYTIRNYLRLSRDKQNQAAKLSASFEQRREKRIELFMQENKDSFLRDFTLLTAKELCSKYSLSQSFFRSLFASLGLERKDLPVVKKRKYIQQSETMKKKGNAKMKATNLSKYGVENPLCLPENKEKRDVANRSLAVIERRKATMKDRYGVTCAFQLPEVRESCKAIASNPEVVAKQLRTKIARYGTANNWNHKKISKTCLEKWGVSNIGQSAEIRKKAVFTALGAVAEDGTSLDSAYEKLVWDYCKRNEIPIRRGPRLAFQYEGKQHYTFIDFEIDGKLVEIKGAHLLAGCFDHSMPVPIDKKIEIYRQNLVTIITDFSEGWPKPESADSNGHKYLDRCCAPLIGVDIDLFRTPSFPFDPCKPKCFYKARVSGNRSPLEAWEDEKLRWKMIMNRINYVGGFIDAKAVLRAMNVTRNCSQPSQFNKSYAKALIEKYITTDVIVDGFAGYGARHDAAIEMNKCYYGIDLNPELVEWHKEKGRSIGLADVASWQKEISKPYSVFICPPYTDPLTGLCIEDYNFKSFDAAAKSKTQFEWLKIIARNFPTAREYLMVCKIIDPGFESFVVEVKKNKSHIGSNSEFVIKISARDVTLLL